MTRYLDITVIGTPGSQGSKTAGVDKNGKPYVRESNKAVRPWRQDVRDAALAALHDSVTQTGFTQGPVEVTILFYLRRPISHFSQRQNAGPGELKLSAPERPAVKPDEDKLQRSTKDALTQAGVYYDDAQIVTSHSEKWYADGRQPGALIRVRSLLNGKDENDGT
jgi:Holliday junction resolvase RusA-like endonuclease